MIKNRKFYKQKPSLKLFILSAFILLGNFMSISAETTVTDEQSFANAINSAETVIIVSNDITLTKNYTITRELTIKSLENATLSWGGAASGTMFTLNNPANLILEDIILDGKGVYATLVKVNSSIFTMNDGSVLKNVKTNSNNRAVNIGNYTNPSVGGTFNMNGGLITEVQLDGAVGCENGTINMRGNASISGNTAYGINMGNSVLNMQDKASISNNEVKERPGVGIIAYKSTINMGIKEKDAPTISGNVSTDSFSGAIYVEECEINMNFDASISENHAQLMNGGVGLVRSTLNMKGNSKINGNITSEGAGGGVFASESTVNLMENASIFNNIVKAEGGKGGGIFMQKTLSLLTIKDSASIYNNQATYGAGIYLNLDTQMQMTGGTISTNTAETSGGGIYSRGNITITDGTIKENQTTNGNGGGIYLTTEATANISGQSYITDNKVFNGNGAGIYTENTTDYHNLTTGDKLIFSKNIATIAYTPPTNVLEKYPTIHFEKSGIEDHPLNNYDINYEGVDAVMYHLKYDANGGMGAFVGPEISPMYTDIVESNTKVGINRNFYTFVGWNTEPDGSGVSYTQDELIQLTRNNITLYAQWTLSNTLWIWLALILTLFMIIMGVVLYCGTRKPCCQCK